MVLEVGLIFDLKFPSQKVCRFLQVLDFEAVELWSQLCFFTCHIQQLPKRATRSRPAVSLPVGPATKKQQKCAHTEKKNKRMSTSSKILSNTFKKMSPQNQIETSDISREHENKICSSSSEENIVRSFFQKRFFKTQHKKSQSESPEIHNHSENCFSWSAKRPSENIWFVCYHQKKIYNDSEPFVGDKQRTVN